MHIFITYVIAGLAIAMPVGAITVEMTKQGLKKGFMHGWAVGLGGMTVDLFLIFALYMGLATVLSIPFIQMSMWLIGAGFLFLIGYDSIKNADRGIVLNGKKTEASFLATYRNGLLVALSPGNLVFWISVFGAVLTNSYNSNEKSTFLIIAAGILCGILLHDIGLLTIVSLTRKVVNRKMIKWFSVIAGLILFGFGMYFIYNFVDTLSNYL